MRVETEECLLLHSVITNKYFHIIRSNVVLHFLPYAIWSITSVLASVVDPEQFFFHIVGVSLHAHSLLDCIHVAQLSALSLPNALDP